MVYGAFVSGDEQEVQSMLREVNELRRARGLQQLEPWWKLPGARPERWLRRVRVPVSEVVDEGGQR
jgi:hypothetical protein